MNDDEAYFLFGEEKPSVYPILISSIIAAIATVILVWLLFESTHLVQTGDYSLFIILLVLSSGAALIVYSMIAKENNEP